MFLYKSTMLSDIMTWIQFSIISILLHNCHCNRDAPNDPSDTLAKLSKSYKLRKSYPSISNDSVNPDKYNINTGILMNDHYTNLNHSENSNLSRKLTVVDNIALEGRSKIDTDAEPENVHYFVLGTIGYTNSLDTVTSTETLSGIPNSKFNKVKPFQTAFRKANILELSAVSNIPELRRETVNPDFSYPDDRSVLKSVETNLQTSSGVQLLHKTLKLTKRAITKSPTAEKSVDDECHIARCQKYAMGLWDRFEQSDAAVLTIFRQLGLDYFQSPRYRKNFCRIFQRLQENCLIHRCKRDKLLMYSPSTWSFSKQSLQLLNKTFNFPPRPLLEHHILEGDPDFYIDPFRFLPGTICRREDPQKPDSALVEMPSQDNLVSWCPHLSPMELNNYSMLIEWIFSTSLGGGTFSDRKDSSPRLNPISCTSVGWRIRFLGQLLTTSCWKRQPVKRAVSSTDELLATHDLIRHSRSNARYPEKPEEGSYLKFNKETSTTEHRHRHRSRDTRKREHKTSTRKKVSKMGENETFNFFCRLHRSMFELYYPMLQCAPSKVSCDHGPSLPSSAEATIPPAVLCEWQFQLVGEAALESETKVTNLGGKAEGQDAAEPSDFVIDPSCESYFEELRKQHGPSSFFDKRKNGAEQGIERSNLMLLILIGMFTALWRLVVK